jgi:hypothetical protein
MFCLFVHAIIEILDKLCHSRIPVCYYARLLVFS